MFDWINTLLALMKSNQETVINDFILTKESSILNYLTVDMIHYLLIKQLALCLIHFEVILVGQHILVLEGFPGVHWLIILSRTSAIKWSWMMLTINPLCRIWNRFRGQLGIDCTSRWGRPSWISFWIWRFSSCRTRRSWRLASRDSI